MGQRQSSPHHSVTKSPSAAFGRLRIDSPHAHGHRSPAAIARQRQLSASSLGKAGVYHHHHQETSPLLISAQQQHKLESLPSDMISIGTTPPPPVYMWIGPALICALAYALYNIFIKKGSASMHPILGGVILQFVAAILGTVLLSVLIWKDGTDELEYDSQGVAWSVCAGAAVGGAEILSFIVSGMGVQAMQSIPIIIGGSVLFGTTLGYVVLQEALTYRGWVGVVLIATGIALVGIDPGGAGSVH